MGLLGAVCATGCGFVLLRGAWWKLRHVAVFAGVLREQRLAGWLRFAVPVVELVVGVGALVLLLPPSTRPDVAVPMLALVVVGVAFAGFSGVRLASGGGGTRCGCVSAEDRLGPHTVVRAVAIAGGGAVGWLADGAADGGPSGLLWSLTAAAGGAVVAAMLLVRL